MLRARLAFLSLAAGLGLGVVGACGSFDESPASPDEGGGDGGLEASSEAAPGDGATGDAPGDGATGDAPGDVAISCVPRPRGCDGGTCTLNDFAGGEGSWTPAGGGQLSTASGSAVFNSSGYSLLESPLREVASMSLRFRFAFDVSVAPAGSAAMGRISVATVRRGDDLLRLAVTTAGTFAICRQGAVACMPLPGQAFVPERVHHVEWEGELSAGGAGGFVDVSVDCRAPTRVHLITPLFEPTDVLYFGIGIVDVVGHQGAVVKFDDVLHQLF